MDRRSCGQENQGRAQYTQIESHALGFFCLFKKRTELVEATTIGEVLSLPFVQLLLSVLLLFVFFFAVLMIIAVFV